MNLDNLIAIEEIKQLKARYFRLMDQKRWDEWGNVFTRDAILRYGPEANEVFEGRQQIVQGLREILADAVTVHHGHMPEIEINSKTTATGTWAMFDFIQMPGVTLTGYGHYEEDYIKIDGKWKFANIKSTRLRVDTTVNTDPD